MTEPTTTTEYRVMRWVPNWEQWHTHRTFTTSAAAFEFIDRQEVLFERGLRLDKVVITTAATVMREPQPSERRVH